ncbi:Septin [Nakaseomyces glabratus]
MDSPSIPNSLFRRKDKHKRGIVYSVMLCGASGTGKTTFANNLLESNLFKHKYNGGLHEFNPNTNDYLTVTKPTKIISFNSNNGLPSQSMENLMDLTNSSEFDQVFNPATQNKDSGIAITSTSFEIRSKNEEKNKYDVDMDTIYLNLIMTLGLGENIDNSICTSEIDLFLRQQFDTVLAEETKIRRNPRFEDTRVHIALYFIENTGHGLREQDVELMKTLTKYTNVLPIISKADSFSPEELKTFKTAVMNDIERYNIPIYKFDIDLTDPSHEFDLDQQTIEENEYLAALQPFATICSDQRNAEGKAVREYPWGSILIDDENISDLKILKNVLFGSHLQDFKDTTQNVLYENYRAEKLSSVTNNKYEATNPQSNDQNIKRQSTVPSLSNFQSLIQTGQIKSYQNLPISPSPSQNGNTNQATENLEDTTNMSVISEHSGMSQGGVPERSQLRNISETVPYVLRHERLLAKQQKLEELEAQSAKELQKRIQELERKAHELKMKERRLLSVSDVPNSPQVSIKRGDTYNDLASMASNR